ncbi:ABC transporter ATP-binding protein [Psychromonas sp. CNPT3]|uniref:ABC transporter ATP-binding protein n=1 Tax=Psychromonas sp. CNPT3 TaxID=314282 RepID=UPI0005A12539|nr:ABC transporter ATP-binding protein [Psychromonas sp. CNPT3]
MFKYFEQLVPALNDVEPTQPPKTLLAFCLHYTKGYVPALLVMTVLTALLAILEVSLFGFMGKLVDWLITKNPETFLQEESTTLIMMSVMILILIPILTILHSLVVHQVLLGNYPMSIRWFAHRYLLKQSFSFYQDDFAGRIATKVMQTSLAVRETVMKLLDVMVYVSVYFFAMIFMVAQADYRLAIPMLIWLFVYLALQMYFVPKLKDISSKQADARSTMTGRIVDSYTNISTVKLFAHTDAESAYAKQGMQGFLETVYKQMRLVTGISVSVQISNYILVFAIGALSISLWMQSAISVGAIALSISLALRLNGMAQWIMWEISHLFENIGTVTDGMATLSKPNIIEDEKDAKALIIKKGEIHFKNMSFNYGEKNDVINNFDLKIKAGEKVGLVGRSGAGKSTLVNLLLRFYDVERGQILIDGQDIKKVQQESLRLQIGMVTQDTSLLHRSIRENILYGRPNASEDDLILACQQAQADHFIKDLTDNEGDQGYDAQVGERGVKLSGGQRQRIAIARVILKDAPILVLDEATSALDSEVESAIQESLYELMHGKTVIAIAHRLSTIAAMDRLIVLDKGKIIEQGSHQELLLAGGVYAQLWKHQTGGFLGMN